MSTQELAKKIHQIKELQRLSEELTAELEALKDEVKQAMTEQNTDTLLIDCFKVTWKAVTSTRFDSTAFKQAMPELYQQYSKPTESRRFLIT